MVNADIFVKMTVHFAITIILLFQYKTLKEHNYTVYMTSKNCYEEIIHRNFRRLFMAVMLESYYNFMGVFLTNSLACIL